MGLSLHNPHASLYLSDLDPDPSPHDDESPIFRQRLDGPTTSPKHGRAHHRTVLPCQPVPDYHPAFLKPVQQQSRSRTPCHITKTREVSDHRQGVSDRRPGRAGRDMTRSYSSEMGALPRRPSLEREEAFCGDRPGKKRRRGGETGWDTEGHWDEPADETTQQLYRIGLLYDDEYERGELFGFGALSEPVYDIKMMERKSKRRKGQETGMRVENRDWLGFGHGLPLKLELEVSLTALGEDEDLVALMRGCDRDETRTDNLEGEETQTEAQAEALTTLGELPGWVTDSEYSEDEVELGGGETELSGDDWELMDGDDDSSGSEMCGWDMYD